jgi:hypothetical protein
MSEDQRSNIKLIAQNEKQFKRLLKVREALPLGCLSSIKSIGFGFGENIRFQYHENLSRNNPICVPGPVTSIKFTAPSAAGISRDNQNEMLIYTGSLCMSTIPYKAEPYDLMVFQLKIDYGTEAI